MWLFEWLHKRYFVIFIYVNRYKRRKYGFILKFAKFQPIQFLRCLWMYKRNLALFKTMIFSVSGRSTEFPGNMVGIVENWREYQFFKQHPTAPFLLPVHFSFFGLCNVMPLKKDVSRDIHVLTIFMNLTVGNNLDMHHFGNLDNFCMYCGPRPLIRPGIFTYHTPLKTSTCTIPKNMIYTI